MTEPISSYFRCYSFLRNYQHFVCHFLEGFSALKAMFFFSTYCTLNNRERILDWVEIWRVRREKFEFAAFFFDHGLEILKIASASQFTHFWYLWDVYSSIIHHNYRLWPRIWIAMGEDVVLDELFEYFCIYCPTKDNACHISIDRDCWQERQVFCFLCGDFWDDTLAFWSPTFLASAKLWIHARFIEKNELIRSPLRDFHNPMFAEDLVAFPCLFLKL